VRKRRRLARVLLAATAAFTLVFSEAADAALSVAKNPRYLEDDGKPVVLFGSGFWTIIGDTSVDIVEHNTWYARYGANANRASLFAFCTAAPEGKGLCPWLRTGPGLANDGKPKFDLAKPNEAFWRRANAYFSDCRERDIYVLLQIFDEPYVEGGDDRWRLNPFNPENNVNRIPGLPGGNGSGEEAFYDPDNEPLMKIQDALVRRLLDETVGRHGNIIYEIGNEINMDSVTRKARAWQQHWIDFFRRYEEEHPGLNLLLSNDTRADLLEAGKDGFDVINHHGAVGIDINRTPTHELAQRIYQEIARDFAAYRRPIINSRPCSDPDRTNYSDIVSGVKGRVLYWSYFLSGGHIIGFRTTLESWKEGTTAETIIMNLRKFIDGTHFERMSPRPDLVEGNALCLAEPGKQYVVYLPVGGEVTVNLADLPKGEKLAVRRYDPRSGESVNLGLAETGRYRFKSPTSGEGQDWALYIASESP
jgi:hypothetical protein